MILNYFLTAFLGGSGEGYWAPPFKHNLLRGSLEFINFVITEIYYFLKWVEKTGTNIFLKL
jgi:hypothetical protein